jgi:hypothetical protein
MEINQVARNCPAVTAQTNDGRQQEAWACPVTCTSNLTPCCSQIERVNFRALGASQTPVEVSGDAARLINIYFASSIGIF